MLQIANVLIYGGITATVSLAVGMYHDARIGLLCASVGCVITGICLAVKAPANDR